MRILILFLCLLSSSQGTVYYVSTAGSDANTAGQAQSPATPWRTLTHGLGTISSGDTLLLADGTYAEIVPVVVPNFTAMTFVASQSATANNVIITGSGGTPFAILSSAGNNITYSNLSFFPISTASSETVAALGSNIMFSGCIFTTTPDASHVSNAGMGVSGTAVSVLGCTMNQSADTHTSIGVQMGNGSSNTFFGGCSMLMTGRCFNGAQALGYLTISNCSLTSKGDTATSLYYSTNLIIQSCSITGSLDGIDLTQCKNATIKDSTISGHLTHGIMFGADSAFNPSTDATASGVVSNCLITTSGDHGLLFGAGCSNVQAYANEIHALSWCIVIKASEASDIRSNRLYGGNGALNPVSILFKESRGATVASGNVIYPYTGTVGLAAIAGDSGNNFTNVIYTNNTMFVPDASTLAVSWGGNSSLIGGGHDLGGSVLDYNAYYFPGQMKVGQLNGGTVATNISMWQTDWVGYDGVSGNESHSTAGPQPNESQASLTSLTLGKAVFGP